MFEIYKYMFQNGMADKDELKTYVPNFGLSESEYQEIVGGTNEEAKPVEG